MMEENKKGSTLYVVLGVATLVVAIIGATFAYFSATASNNDVIKGDTAEAGGLTLKVEPITTGTNNNIIPLNLIADDKYPDSQFEKAMEKKCKDDLGNNVCAVYRVTVNNMSKTSTIQVQGKLNLNSTATNMYWTLIDATVTETPAEGEGTPATVTLATGTAKADFAMVKQNLDGYLTYSADKDETSQLNKAANLSLSGTDGDTSSKSFYVLVWLEETGAEQQDSDASSADSKKSYTGNITFDAVDAQGNKSGVTATFLS